MKLFSIHHINNFNIITDWLAPQNYSNALHTIVKKKHNSTFDCHWVGLTAKWMQKLEPHILGCYRELGDINSLEISGLIANWKEVTRLIDFCKVFLSNTCIKNLLLQESPTILNKILKKLCSQYLGASLIHLYKIKY